MKRMAAQLVVRPPNRRGKALRVMIERCGYSLALLPFLVDWVENGGWPQRPRDFVTELIFGVMIVIGVTYLHRLHRHAESLRHLAETDDLTGLGNRGRFRFDIESAVERAHDAGRSLVLAYVDVDRFKQVNDTLGHLAGDELLCGVANALQRSVRQGTDACYRLGGDEFAVLLWNVESAQALEVLRRGFAKAAFSIGASVSCSVGVVTLNSGEVAADLLRRADALMYAAKRSEQVVPNALDGYFGKVSGGAAVGSDRSPLTTQSPRAARRSAVAR